MIKLNFVPDSFGIGVTIPIPKGDKNRVFNKLEDFRGITISPIYCQRFLNFAYLNVLKNIWLALTDNLDLKKVLVVVMLL